MYAASIGPLPGAFPPPLGGCVASRFELKAALQRRGVVQTFLAFDPATERDVELVLFDPAYTGANAWAAFARVVTAAASANVKNLALPSEVSSTLPDTPYCIVDRLVTRRLDRLREEEGLMPWERALTLGERIAEVLHNVHAATHVAHRALLPSRCTVTATDAVLVLDYGVAELESAEGRSAETVYRSPEQQHGGGDQRSDVYSLAVILFELISGQRPAGKLPPRLRSLITVPQAVDGLLSRALARNPDQRHTDLSVLRAAIRDILGLPALPFEGPKKIEHAPPVTASSQLAPPDFAAPEFAVAPTSTVFQGSRKPDLSPPSIPARTSSLVSSDKTPLLRIGSPAAGADSQGIGAPIDTSPAMMTLTLGGAHAISRAGSPGADITAVDRTEVLPVVTRRRPQVDPPTERIIRPHKLQAAATAALPATSGHAASFDELPTISRMPVSRAPRAAQAVSTSSTVGPTDLERTEILGRSVLRIHDDRTEMFRKPPEGPPELSTLMLTKNEVSSGPIAQTTSPGTGVPSIPDSRTPSNTPTTFSIDKKLVLINLALVTLVLLGLLVTSLL